MVFAIAIAAFASTLLGGMAALKFRDKLHLVLGFSAGAVIAVALFDLLPEALELGESEFGHSSMIALVAAGFFLYLLLDRLIFFHAHHAHEHREDHAKEKHGTLSALALCLHSFLDGIAIGLAFQVSSSVGSIVTIAVLVHDFSDGINTVGLISRGGGEKSRARMWLVADALAPLAGVASTFLFTISESELGAILALFAGFFLYIGASDLIPESHHAHPRFLTTIMTLVGALVLYGAIRLAGI